MYFVYFQLHYTIQKGYFFLKLIDTYRFLQTSLHKLVEILPEQELHYTKYQFPDVTQFNFPKTKNYFPYKYLDSIQKLADEELPEYELFYFVVR